MKNIFCLLFFIFSFAAIADCTSPAAPQGTMRFFSGDYQYCNQYNLWYSMKAVPEMPGAACTSAGVLSGESFCDGANLYSIDSKLALGSSCSTPNEIRYFSNTLNICINGSWFQTGYCQSCKPTCEQLTKLSQCNARGGECYWDNYVKTCNSSEIGGGGGGTVIVPGDDS